MVDIQAPLLPRSRLCSFKSKKSGKGGKKPTCIRSSWKKSNGRRKSTECGKGVWPLGRNVIRKAKAHFELNLVREVKDNKKVSLSMTIAK